MAGRTTDGQTITVVRVGVVAPSIDGAHAVLSAHSAIVADAINGRDLTPAISRLAELADLFELPDDERDVLLRVRRHIDGLENDDEGANE